MKQSNYLISERRVRAAIYEMYDENNPDNRPREISHGVFKQLDEVVTAAIYELITEESCRGGRLNANGEFNIEYQPE